MEKKVKLILIYLAQYTNFFFGGWGAGVGCFPGGSDLKESIYNVETWVP